MKKNKQQTLEKSRSNVIPKIILFVLLVFSLLFSLISLVLSPQDTTKNWLATFFQNLSTDFLGTLITYLLLENIIGNWKEKLREERLQSLQIAEQQRKRFEQQITWSQELKHNTTLVEVQKTMDQMINLNLLKGINVSGINLNNIKLDSANFSESNLSDITFINSILQNCIFDLSTLYKINFTAATIDNADFKHTKCIGLIFSKSYIHKANFVGCEMPNAMFLNAIIVESSFNEANLSYANFSNSNLEGISFLKTNLKGSDFRGARLYGADIRGAIISETLFDKHTILPDGRPWTADINLSIYL